MNPVIKNTKFGIRVTDDDSILSNVIGSLLRNNTFCPNVSRPPIFSYSNKNGKKTLTTTVFFSDGTKSVVQNMDRDKITTATEKVILSNGSEIEVETASVESREIGLLYAILKRIVCAPDENGNIKDSGMIRFIRRKIENSYNQNVEEQKKIAENEIRKERAKAERIADPKPPKEKNASLRSAIASLQDLIEKMNKKLSD